MRGRKGFTLIELLVVMLIISMLASLLLVGINAVRVAARRGQCQTEINQITLAITEYYNQLGVYPPSGPANDTGKLSDASKKINYALAWPGSGWTSTNHPLVACLTKTFQISAGTDSKGNPVYRTYEALYPKARTKEVADTTGKHVYIMDPYGGPLRYLEDGRRTDGKLARVERHVPILWSAGVDGLEDPQDDQIDNNNDGKVDEQAELVDDVCSWW